VRKSLLILLFIFCFSVLSAEETVQNQEEIKASDTQTNEEIAQPKEKWWFITPTAGTGWGSPIGLTVNAGIDFSFRIIGGFQIGFDVNPKFTPVFHTGKDLHEIYFLPVKWKIRYDFPVKSPGLKFVNLWAAAGINLIWAVPDKDADLFLNLGNRESEYDDKYYFYKRFTWGLAVDLIFKNNMVLRLGLYDALPIPYFPLQLNTEIGYRF